MWLDTPVFFEDMEYISNTKYIPWYDLKNKVIFVTGGTGLIGSTCISALLYVCGKKDLNLKVLALVRDIGRAKKQFKEQMKTGNLTLINGDVEHIPVIEEKIDYIIHGACPTASGFFVNNPVETIKTSVIGTVNLLELAKEMDVEGYIYLSSMEVYGQINSEELLNEEMLGFVNPLILRNCYPESKRMCEAICNAYAKEYKIKAVSIRLAQTFGPGVSYDDKRVFAMMARCAINGKDIVLQTKGTSRHPYLYTAQAVTAIFTVLLKGEGGNAYNAANPNTYCSIYEMGKMVAHELSNEKINVIVAENGDVSKYPVPSFLNLDITAISKLGWKPEGDLKTMYIRMIETMEDAYEAAY